MEKVPTTNIISGWELTLKKDYFDFFYVQKKYCFLYFKFSWRGGVSRFSFCLLTRFENSLGSLLPLVCFIHLFWNSLGICFV